MSWCRFGPESQLYIYEDCAGGITCCGCLLSELGHFNCETETEMAEHIVEHARAGHIVPDHLIETVNEIAPCLAFPKKSRVVRFVRVLLRAIRARFSWACFMIQVRRARKQKGAQ